MPLRVRVGDGVEPGALLDLLNTQFDCEYRAGVLTVAKTLRASAVANGGTLVHGEHIVPVPLRKNAVEVMPATLADVDDIVRIVAYWAREGENLPRDESSIVKQIQDFVVAKQGDAVVGCASLMVYNRKLAEIRSLGLLPLSQGKGGGSAIVQACLDRARHLQVKTVFVLTRVPDFFARQGFTLSDKAELPEKVMKDCQFCPKQNACDEIAMVLPLE
ncbi:MAG: N-acetyltransferase [Gammaproteobacteria bacterium]|nr:N-acetyltransferase [Gammaproteobacteria bacterium]